MQIYYNQLDSKLKDDLKPIYIIAGSEIYQEDLFFFSILAKLFHKTYNLFH